MPSDDTKEKLRARRADRAKVPMQEAGQPEPRQDNIRRLRLTLAEALDPGRQRHGLSLLNKALALVILASVGVTILETEPTLTHSYGPWFDIAEKGFILIFVVEYLARLWVAVDDPKFGPGLRGRLRWALTPIALIDFLAIAPALLLPAFAAPTFILRLARLLRMLRLAKLGRFSKAFRLLSEAIASRRYELLLTLGIAGVVLLLAATLLYLVEGPGQPDKFGSIPRALWWSIVTLTTIGYGDVYPITPLGKALAGLTAVIGIGLIAAPTGILAAAFSDVLQRHREEEKAAS